MRRCRRRHHSPSAGTPRGAGRDRPAARPGGGERRSAAPRSPAPPAPLTVGPAQRLEQQVPLHADSRHGDTRLTRNAPARPPSGPRRAAPPTALPEGATLFLRPAPAGPFAPRCHGAERARAGALGAEGPVCCPTEEGSSASSTGSTAGSYSGDVMPLAGSPRALSAASSDVRRPVRSGVRGRGRRRVRAPMDGELRRFRCPMAGTCLRRGRRFCKLRGVFPSHWIFFQALPVIDSPGRAAAVGGACARAGLMRLEGINPRRGGDGALLVPFPELFNCKSLKRGGGSWAPGARQKWRRPL